MDATERTSARDRRRRAGIVAAIAILSIHCLPAAAAVLDATDQGLVKSNLDSAGWRATRDCGFSAPDPTTPGASLWLFCDTWVRRPDGSRYFLTSTAAIGPDTPGRAPDRLTEIGAFDVPTQFLPFATGIACSGPGAYTPAWSTGVAPIPSTTKVLIPYVSLCVTERAMHSKRYGVAEYDLGTRKFTHNATSIFSTSTGDLPIQKRLGKPVYSSGYWYFFTSQCTESFVGCFAGKIYVARVAAGSDSATTRPWTQGSNYKWWNGTGWTSDASTAASIIPSATPIDASVDWSPQRDRFVLVEQTSIAGDFRLWDATAPTGPWIERGRGALPCGSHPDEGFGCRAFIPHPDLSTSESLAISFFNPADQRVRIATVPWPQPAKVQVFTPELGAWFPKVGSAVLYGDPGDIPLPNLMTGKGAFAVWRPSEGNWYIRGVTQPGGEHHGQDGDIPVPGDYNGDGSVDLAVWRPSNQSWYVKDITASGNPIKYGNPNDIPVPADYDGDGQTEMATWRPSNGNWYVRGVTPSGGHHYGQNGDVPVPADYDGDGKVDFAVWRPSNGRWYIEGITPPGGLPYGQSGDIPVPADYTGNRKTDLAVWRPSSARWFVRGEPSIDGIVWGVSTDIPATTILNRKLLQMLHLVP